MARRFVTPSQRKRRILRDALLLAAVLVVLALRLDFPILTAGQAMEAAQARYFFGPGEVIDRIDFPRTANTVKGGQHDRYYILRWGDWYAWCGVDRYGLFWQAGTLEAVENDPDTPLVPLVVSDWEEGAALVVCNRPDIASVEVEFPVYAGSRYLLASIVQDQKTEDHFLVPWRWTDRRSSGSTRRSSASGPTTPPGSWCISPPSRQAGRKTSALPTRTAPPPAIRLLKR